MRLSEREQFNQLLQENEMLKAKFEEISHLIDFEEKWLIEAKSFNVDVGIALDAIKSKINALK